MPRTADDIFDERRLLLNSMANSNSTANDSASNDTLPWEEYHNEGELTYGDLGLEGDLDFFSIYFSTPRFASETALALASAVLNFIALLTLVNQHLARPTKAVYRCLFINLALTNLLISIVQWFCNNVLYFFEYPLIVLLNEGRVCTFVVYLTSALFVSSSFGMVSSLTMLGFATYQYFAICKPLRNIAVMSTTRVAAFLVMSWFLSFFFCCLPFVVLLLMAEYASDCNESFIRVIEHSMVIGVNVSVSVVGAIYLAVIFICLRIYLEIRRLQMRLLQFRYDQNIKHERKAFVTTVILLATLTFYFLPHTIIYLVTFNGSSDQQSFRNTPLVHYMNLLPYFKFLTDPLIYGLRLRRTPATRGSGSGCCGGGRCTGRTGRRSWHICGDQGSSSYEMASTTTGNSCSLAAYQRRRSLASRHTSVCTTTTCGIVQMQIVDPAAAHEPPPSAV